MRQTSRRAFLNGLPAVALAGCTGRSPGTGPDEDDDATTPDSRTPMSPDDDAVRWIAEFDHAITERPTVSGDVAYVTTDARRGSIGTPTTPLDEPPGSLAAVSAADGDVQWQTSLPQPPASSPHVGARGVHLVTGYSSGLHGVGQRFWQFSGDGRKRWETDSVDEFLYPLAFDGERAYLGTADDALSTSGQPLFGISLDDGSRSWEVESGDAFDGRLFDGQLLVSLGGMALASYDPLDGSRNWTADGQPLGNANDELATVDGAAFVARSVDDGAESLVAIDVDGGTDRWSFAPEGYGRFVPTGVGVGDGTVVATEYDGVVFGLDPGDGSERWRFETDGRTRVEPLAVGGSVYVGDDGGGVYAVDVATGDEQWRQAVEGAVSWLGASGGVLVVDARHDNGRTVTGFDADDGTALWRYRLDGDATRVALGGGRAYLGTADGTLVALGVDE